MNENGISDQFWGQPVEGRIAVRNGLPDENLCVFASWREDKTSNDWYSRKDAKTLVCGLSTGDDACFTSFLLSLC